MFVLFYGIFEMFRAEYGRSSHDNYIDTAIDNLFVGIQSYKTLVCRDIDILFFLQFVVRDFRLIVSCALRLGKQEAIRVALRLCTTL